MIGRRHFLACLLLCLAPALQAQVPQAGGQPEMTREEQAVHAAHLAYLERITPQLAASGEARALAYAALLREMRAAADWDREEPPPPDAQAREWRRTAFSRAGADIVALALLAPDPGADTEDAGRTEALARWRQLEPNNLAAWLHDARATPQQVLEAARAARRVDSHWYAQVRWILEAHRAHPPAPAEAARLHDGAGGRPSTLDGYAAIHAMGLLAATAMPGFQPLLTYCRQVAAEAPGSVQAQDCRRTGELLREGDTALSRSLGFALSERVAAGAAERRALAEARRRFDWQMYEWGRLSEDAPAGGIDDFVRLLADPAIGSEAALVERLLTEAGVPLDPPARWQPPRY